MDILLTPVQARVLGALIEKEITTPDYYPLSLSALTAACNQKSNREPIMKLSETEVQDAVDGLSRIRLVWEKNPSGSRVPKYAHRLSNTLGLTHDFTPKELAVLCVLMLRGPQTAGEVRTRTVRFCDFQDLGEAEATLLGLCERDDGPYVSKLPRRPGKKEARFAHLLCGDVAELPQDPVGSAASESDTGRVDELERRLEALHAEVNQLRRRLDELKGPPPVP